MTPSSFHFSTDLSRRLALIFLLSLFVLSICLSLKKPVRPVVIIGEPIIRHIPDTIPLMCIETAKPRKQKEMCEEKR